VRPAQSWAPAALATPSSAGDLLYKRWLNPLNSSHPPLATGVALIIAQPDEVRDEIDAARSLREAGYLVFYSIGDSPINDHEIGILKNIGASVRPQLEDKKLPTPSLIFTAINNETPAVKLAKTRKAKFVTGLTDLKRLLRSSFMASPAS
jgi:hypothetical protein